MRILILATLALAACAAPKPASVIGSTPAMVTICAPSGPLRDTMRLAQQTCQASGRNAELISEPTTLCEDASLKSAQRWVHNYRCVQ